MPRYRSEGQKLPVPSYPATTDKKAASVSPPAYKELKDAVLYPIPAAVPSHEAARKAFVPVTRDMGYGGTRPDPSYGNGYHTGGERGGFPAGRDGLVPGYPERAAPGGYPGSRILQTPPSHPLPEYPVHYLSQQVKLFCMESK